MPSISRRSDRSRDQWQALIARTERSELNLTEFCRRESVSTASFYAWRNRLRPRAGAQLASALPRSDFVERGTLDQTGDGGGPRLIELELGTGMILRQRKRFFLGPACSSQRTL